MLFRERNDNQICSFMLFCWKHTICFSFSFAQDKHEIRIEFQNLRAQMGNGVSVEHYFRINMLSEKRQKKL